MMTVAPLLANAAAVSLQKREKKRREKKEVD
jgi:hypothetical protein